METKHSLIKSFGFAFEGIAAEFRKGRNFRIQIFIGVAAIILGFIFRVSSAEWFGLIFVISTVLILELLNTAVEEMVDLVEPEINPKAKIAKDVSAGAVLVASAASIAVGILIFLPKIFNL